MRGIKLRPFERIDFSSGESDRFSGIQLTKLCALGAIGVCRGTEGLGNLEFLERVCTLYNLRFKSWIVCFILVASDGSNKVEIWCLRQVMVLV